MIIGIAVIFRVTNSNTERMRKVNLILFSFHLKFLNFRANISIGDTSNSEKTRVIVTNSQSWYNQEPMVAGSNGNEVMKMVFAGVFRPINDSVCLVSILKMASLRAEKTAMLNPM